MLDPLTKYTTYWLFRNVKAYFAFFNDPRIEYTDWWSISTQLIYSLVSFNNDHKLITIHNLERTYPYAYEEEYGGEITTHG